MRQLSTFAVVAWHHCLASFLVPVIVFAMAASPRGIVAQPSGPRPPEPPLEADELTATSGSPRKPVAPAEVLKFEQSKVAAQTTELEERMFRLAESLKKIEPENSSRLILGLRFAREELIVHQMQQTERLLDNMKLDDAIAEQKQLLLRLQRLHDLLLSEDLDFQMRLARLKQLRSILGKLDTVITEENREKQITLDLFNKAKADTDRKLETLEKQREQKQFDSLQRDQAANRNRTDSITQNVQRLGSAGTRAAGELTRAAGNMSSAERALQLRKAQSAGQKQEEALQSLRVAREDLQHEHDSLLDSLRAEVRPRVLEALKRMLEQQTAVRISSEAIRPKLKEKSRRAFTAVVALSRSEQQILKTADEIISLVEETEFGIALPAALNVVRRSMEKVRKSLSDGVCDEAVIRREREIEADLTTLLEAMKRMPSPKSKSQQPKKGSPQQRKRELNRMLAEVKMIRMLQVRINQETVEVDDQRTPGEEQLSREIREAIRAVEQGQEAVRATTEKLGKQRGA